MIKNIIIGIYYNSKIDKQRNAFVKKNSFSYIKPWYDSIKNLDMYGVLLHDNSCDKDFINQYKSDNFNFVYRGDYQYNYLINVYKFLDIRNFLINNVFDNILITDVSDVIFKKNPFSIFTKNNIYVGSEQNKNGSFRITKNSKWAKRVFSRLYKNYPFWNKPLLNCGIVGGSYETVLDFLNKFKLECDNNKFDDNKFNTHDMTITNYLVYKYFNDRYTTGLPLHSVFKKYDINNPQAYIIHK